MASAMATSSVGYAQKLPIKSAPWHALVAWDMFFNALSTGLFMTAALCELASAAVFTPIARVAYPLALLFLLTDLVLLVLDLGDRSRFHHMLRVFKPSSPMSFGVWSLTMFSLPLTVAAIFGVLPEGDVVRLVRRTAVIVGLLPALASVVYKGVLLSTSAQPGWKDARWLGGYHTFSAVVLGCAVMIVLAYPMDQARAMEMLRSALAILLVIQFIPAALLGAALSPVVSLVFSATHWSATIFGVLAAGMVLPLTIVVLDGEPMWMLVAALLVIVGNLPARFVIVHLPHLVSNHS
jgi:Ni/Fe-hydrogenase subunit HybB-like protein